MDHAEVTERLELAAAEPGGLDRLLDAGSPEAEDLRTHIAGCAACRAEADELRGSAATIRDVIRATPGPELRARTLDLVATSGRRRGPDARTSAPRSRFQLRSLIPAMSLGGVAVAVLAVALVWRSVDARLTAADARIAQQQSAIAGLTVVTDWTMRLGSAEDARLLHLAAPGASGSTEDGASGTVLFSSARGELVMIATGLPVPPAGYQYGCWIDQGAGPVRIGRMYRTGAVAYWGGAVDRLRGIQAPFTMGVSLVRAASTAAGEPVLIGRQ